jgi:adenosylhomocysteine nucleosidase
MKRVQFIEWLLILSFVFSVGCQSKQSQSYGPKSFSGDGFTAIVVAYAPEMIGVEEVIAANADASIDSELTIKGVRYSLGSYQGQPIVVFATGMSIANAAMTMQMAIDYFPIKEVIYMGIAGAVNPELQPGDVIIPERWYYHDESVYSNPDPEEEGAFILPDYYESFLETQLKRKATDPNEPSYEPFAFIQPDEVLVIKDGMSEPEGKAYFEATPRLLEVAIAAVADLEPETVVDLRDTLYSVGGNGVTGSVFMDNRAYRKWIRNVWNAEVTEMESAAIGQVCYINEIDWIIIRAISDLAGGQEGKNVENHYDVAASRVGAKVLFAILDELLSSVE